MFATTKFHTAKPFAATVRNLTYFVNGGKKGIRTLERVLAVTRFPIVRLRPAQPSFRIIYRLAYAVDLYILSQLIRFVKHFLKFFPKILLLFPRLRQLTLKMRFWLFFYTSNVFSKIRLFYLKKTDKHDIIKMYICGNNKFVVLKRKKPSPNIQRERNPFGA